MQQWIKAVSLSTVFFLSGCEYIDDMPIVGRYIAKNVCAGLFVEGFEEDLLIKEYITPVVPVINNTWKVNVDYDAQTVSVSNSFFSGAGARALFRPPIGCVSPINESDDELLTQAPYALTDKLLDDQEPWPYGSGGAPANPVDGVDYNLLELALDDAFSEPGQVNTVAMVVIYDGQLVAERYAGGINEFSPLKGYSMSKSVINGLMGQLHEDGTFDIFATTGLPEWAEDDRAHITIEQLMRMESGLRYTERAIGNNNDQGKVLYGNQRPLEYALSLPIESAPGSQFNYSSADNVILGTLIQDELGGSQEAYEYYKDSFFNRIDAVTAVLEHDVQGYFSSAESVFLSARDWARFAQLYMNNGEWNGEQILSLEWVDETLTPGESYKGYGRNIWTNIDQVALPKLPEDTFAFVGALERFVIGVPSRKTIVVRIGFSHNRTAVDINDIVNDVLLALPETP